LKSKWTFAGILALALLGVSGCQTISFYGQAIRGEYQLLAHRRSIEDVLADPKAPANLKDQLRLLQNLLAFANSDLKLPVDGHYKKYVDIHRRYVVWNVEAAAEFSLEPKSWWYPLVGTLEYRGYFSERRARVYAARLEKKGYDVYMGGVEAYSTLGWFKDPVLNTFIFEPGPDLAELIFHELGHQEVFARGDEDFNEAFATSVGEEGSRRWLQANQDVKGRETYLAELRRNQQFVHLIQETRLKLMSVYGDERTEGGRIKSSRKNADVPKEQLRREKEALLKELQERYAKLKTEWGGDTEYDAWFARHVNNAHLNSVAAYYDLLPGFEHLLAMNGGDLEKFYQAVERLAQMPKKTRHEFLMSLAKGK
jgi:predicted aminopeptidase